MTTCGTRQPADREAARLPLTKCGVSASYRIRSAVCVRGVLRVGWERGHYLRGVLDLSLVRYRYMPAVKMNGTDELGSSNLVFMGPIGGVTEGQGY